MSPEHFSFAIYGSHTGEHEARTIEASRTLGKEIAERGHRVITGGGKGVAYEAAEAAADAGGEVVGHSFARSQQEHDELGLPTEAFTTIKFVPKDYELAESVEARRLFRNITTAAEADAAIVISGAWGTTNEATTVEHQGKPLGVVTGTGGVADQLPGLLEKLPSKRIPKFVSSDNPVEVLDELEAHLREAAE